MRKKFLFFCFFFLLLVLIFFLARNIILKTFVQNYLQDAFQVQSSWEKIDLGFNDFKAAKINLTKDDYYFFAEKILLNFHLMHLDGPENYRLEIKNAFLEAGDAASIKFNLIPFLHYHLLEAKDLRIGDAFVEDLKLSLNFKKEKLNFYDFQANFLQPESALSGQVDFFDLENICGKLFFKNFPFGTLVDLFEKKGDFKVSGDFGGKINFCWGREGFSNLEGNITAGQPGVIDIRRDAPLEFLKNYIEEDSYRYLLDSLKNYKYDEGSIELAKEEGVVIVTINFASELSGARRITINLHDLPGGKK